MIFYLVSAKRENESVVITRLQQRQRSLISIFSKTSRSDTGEQPNQLSGKVTSISIQPSPLVQSKVVWIDTVQD